MNQLCRYCGSELELVREESKSFLVCHLCRKRFRAAPKSKEAPAASSRSSDAVPPKRKKKRKNRSRATDSGLVRFFESDAGPTAALGLFIFALVATGVSFAMRKSHPEIGLLLGMLMAIPAFVCGIVGALWFLVVVLRAGIVHLLLVLLVPFYSLFFLLMNWEDTRKPFALNGLGILLAFCMVVCIGGMADKRNRPHPARVVGHGRPAQHNPNFPPAGAQPNRQAPQPPQFRNPALLGWPDGEADDPFDVDTIEPVSFPPLGEWESRNGLRFQAIKSEENTGVGAGMKLHIHLPEHAEPGTLPLVLIAPAGSNCLTGNILVGKDHPEHLPYAKAGMAVVAYSLDGPMIDSPILSELLLLGAMRRFAQANAGVTNARSALEYALANIPEVDPDRIYAVGHSSAGTVALLFAAHEPRLAGCIAYAPAVDVLRFHKQGGAEYPAHIAAFAVRASPTTHAARIDCPVFLFHAHDDSVTAVSETQEFARMLAKHGKQPRVKLVPTGDHYESMIDKGIPAGIEWIQSR